MKKIFYLGYYDVPENSAENRNVVLAATNKMKYIISVLDNLGYKVSVISAAATKNRKRYSRKHIVLGQNSELLLLKTLSWGNKLQRIISIFYMRFQLFKHLVSTLEKGDSILVYHSVAYAGIVRLAKRIKKFKLILEVEEIYSDVNGSDSDRKKEYKLFKKADAFIFPTELLNEKLNPDNKPYAIIYGTYQIEWDRKCKFDGKKIHCVYAGTFDSRKGGALAAVDAAKYLDSNYHIHILGFGNEKDTSILMNKIEDLSKICACKITYEGLLSGEEYIHFLQSCDIGFSTQNPHAKFNDTSFPSKILSYMANGLHVVSIRIPVVENSAIGKYVSYYERQTPEDIANAVKSVNFTDPYDSRKIIYQLNSEFQYKIKELIDG